MKQSEELESSVIKFCLLVIDRTTLYCCLIKVYYTNTDFFFLAANNDYLGFFRKKDATFIMFLSDGHSYIWRLFKMGQKLLATEPVRLHPGKQAPRIGGQYIFEGRTIENLKRSEVYVRF